MAPYLSENIPSLFADFFHFEMGVDENHNETRTQAGERFEKTSATLGGTLPNESKGSVENSQNISKNQSVQEPEIPIPEIPVPELPTIDPVQVTTEAFLAPLDSFITTFSNKSVNESILERNVAGIVITSQEAGQIIQVNIFFSLKTVL